MRLLFTTWAWTTHLYPMVPLAWACRAAGHDVRVASQPALIDAIVGTGLPAVSVGRDVDAIGYHQHRITPAMDYENDGARTPEELERRTHERLHIALGLYVDIMDAMVDDLLSLGRAWRPHAVVYDPLTWAGPLVARDLGVPAARTLFGSDVSAIFKPDGTGVLAPLLERLGSPEPDTMGDLTIDPCPPLMQLDAPVRRQRFNYVPYSGLSTVPPHAHERGARRRLCLTWGTSTDRLAGRRAFLPPAVLEAVCALDAELVIAVVARQRHMVPELPAGVRVVESVPLDVLLPTCDAVIHQGGGGTTLTAVKHGVPQLHLPQLSDQTYNGRCLAAAGAGTMLRADEADAESVRVEAQRLLDESSYRTNALALARDMAAQPPLSAAVDVIARMAEELAAASGDRLGVTA